MKTVLKYFVQGLIITLPITVTIFVILGVLDFFDALFEGVLPWHVPGLGIVLAFALITVAGFLASNFISKSVENLLDDLMRKAPIIKIVYFAVKDIISTMVDKERRFEKPVMVKLSDEMEIYKLGFITQEDMTELGFEEDMVSVFLPHSYNISGNQFIVPRRNVKTMEVPSSEMMKFIMSGGMAKIDHSRKRKEKVEDQLGKED